MNFMDEFIDGVARSRNPSMESVDSAERPAGRPVRLAFRKLVRNHCDSLFAEGQFLIRNCSGKPGGLRAVQRRLSAGLFGTTVFPYLRRASFLSGPAPASRVASGGRHGGQRPAFKILEPSARPADPVPTGYCSCCKAPESLFRILKGFRWAGGNPVA